jgi:hypothetical protein
LRLSKEPSRGAGSPQRTKAVVIVHNGRVIAERYARVDEPAPVAAGSNPSDPRHAITVEELMRMASGLDLDEEDAGIGNPSDQMLYLQRDMADRLLLHACERSRLGEVRIAVRVHGRVPPDGFFASGALIAALAS